MPPPRSRFKWDPSTGQYRRPNGRFVPRTEIRAVLDKAIDSGSSRIRDLGIALRDGRITQRAWAVEMKTTMKSMHLYSGAAAKGGWAQLTNAELGKIGAQLKDQYKYLDKFSAQLRTGLPLDGRFLSRVELYAEASRGTYMAIEEREMELLGREEYRNLLGAADHCDDCLDQTARGWVKIGELIEVGDRQCLSRCRCVFEYR